MPKLSLSWAWCNLWVGVFWDRKKRDLYVCPFPTVTLKLEFGDGLPVFPIEKHDAVKAKPEKRDFWMVGPTEIRQWPPK